MRFPSSTQLSSVRQDGQLLYFVHARAAFCVETCVTCVSCKYVSP
jgi:hypothetical protein